MAFGVPSPAIVERVGGVTGTRRPSWLRHRTLSEAIYQLKTAHDLAGQRLGHCVTFGATHNEGATMGAESGRKAN
jgi:hypothetical protein